MTVSGSCLCGCFAFGREGASFVSAKAPRVEIADALPRFDEMPTGDFA